MMPPGLSGGGGDSFSGDPSDAADLDDDGSDTDESSYDPSRDPTPIPDDDPEPEPEPADEFGDELGGDPVGSTDPDPEPDPAPETPSSPGLDPGGSAGETDDPDPTGGGANEDTGSTSPSAGSGQPSDGTSQFDDELGGDPADAGRSGPSDADFSDRQRDAASQLDDRFENADIGPEDVVVGDGTARLTDEARESVAAAQRGAAGDLVGDPVGRPGTDETTAADAPGDATTAADDDQGRLDELGEQYTENIAEPIGEAFGQTTPVAVAERRVLGTDRLTRQFESAGTTVAQIGNVPGNIAGGIDTVQALDRASSTAFDPVVIGGVPTGVRVPDIEGQQEVGAAAATTGAAAATRAANNPFRASGTLLGGAAVGVGSAGAVRGAGRLARGADDVAPSSGTSGSGASSLDDVLSRGSSGTSRTPNVELRNDPNAGPIDIDPMVAEQISDRVTNRLPDNRPAGTTSSDVFGTAGGPRPRVSTGRSVADDLAARLDEIEPAGDSVSDVFGAAGRPGPRVTTGPTVRDVLPSNRPTGETLPDIFGTAGGPGARVTTGRTVGDVLPSNAVAGDTPSDIFGTAPRAGTITDRLPSNAPAGDTPSDIFGTAPRIGTITDRLPSNRAAGDTPSDIFGTARAADDTPSISRDTTLRIGPSRPSRSSVARSSDDDAIELEVDEDDLDEFDLEFDADDADDTTSDTLDFESDVGGGQGGGGTAQLSRMRSRDSDSGRIDADTVTRRQGADDVSDSVTAAGIGLAAANDPTGISAGGDDTTAPAVGFDPAVDLDAGVGVGTVSGIESPTDVTGPTDTTGTTTTSTTTTDTATPTDTTTTPTTRTPTTTRPVVPSLTPTAIGGRPRLPLDRSGGGDDEDRGRGLTATDAEFENPTRGLGEVDDALTEDLGAFDGP